jgi:YebC/PmpR family DNA-binding regulatory protein
MSGHSHYATTHRQKELKDAARAKVFSKLSRGISIAVKTGGGDNPDFNFKLRMMIDKARAYGMPKENIERAISKGGGGEALDEVVYEGFGPFGIYLVVVTATDNRNRTGQEIKNILERAGGKLGGPNSVAFNFDQMGLIVIKKAGDNEETELKLIDLGVSDIEDAGDNLYVYVRHNELQGMRAKIEGLGLEVVSSELVLKPKNQVVISDQREVQKITSFLGELEEHDDVQKVFSNVSIT